MQRSLMDYVFEPKLRIVIGIDLSTAMYIAHI